MSRETIRKLLGGYATGTLTAEEQQTLFEAALDDQELFDALARDQSLRDLLRDPATRAQLLAAIDDAPAPWHRRLRHWMWGHAVGLSAVACFVAVGVYIANVVRFTPARVVVVATTPTTVEVNGSAEAPAKPNRVFDVAAAQKARPAASSKLPPPPEIALLKQAPRLPLPAPAPEIPPPAATPMAVLGGRAGALAFRPAQSAAGGGPAGAASIPAAVRADVPVATTPGVGVTATNEPVQTASSEKSKLVDSDQVANLSLKGRDLFAIMQAAPPAAGPANFQAVDANSRVEPGMDSVAEVQGGRLDPALLALIQHAQSGAKPTPDENRFVSQGAAYVRLTLTNASADTLGQLKSAGLTITAQQRNEISGRIPIEKLADLARFPFVVWIAPR